MRYQQKQLVTERHKPSPIPNTKILIKVMAVTSGKHSEHDTETACFVICTLLERLRHRNVHRTPRSTWTQSTDTMCVPGILRTISSQCGHHTAGLSRPDVRHFTSLHFTSLHFTSLHFTSLHFTYIFHGADSKQITKVLFLCLLSAWFTATANGRVSTKFLTRVIDNFCVWLQMDKKNGSLLDASHCEKRLLALSWTEFNETWYLNIFRTCQENSSFA